MLFLVGAMTVVVATALLRWSQPAYAPLQASPGAAAAAARAEVARAERRTALRATRATRVAAVTTSQLESSEPLAWWPEEQVAVSSEEPALDLWDAATGVDAIEEYLRLMQPEEQEEPEEVAPVESADDASAPASEAALSTPVEPAGSVSWSDLESDASIDVEARRDDEAWERLFGMLRPSQEALARAREAHGVSRAVERAQGSRVEGVEGVEGVGAVVSVIVPPQRDGAPVSRAALVSASASAGSGSATTSGARAVRRCGVCREPGHDRRRCPGARSA